MRRKIGGLVVLVLVLASVAPASAVPPTQISGRVTDETGTGIGRICVTTHAPAFGQADYTTTADDGTYTLEVTPGLYRVRFADCYVYRAHPFETEWYDDALEEAAAELLLVAHEPLTGIDATLTPKGAIVGRVVDQFGAPVPLRCVARVKDTYEWLSVTTDLDGRFTVPGDHGESYTVAYGFCGTNPEHEPYVPEWYADVPFESQATHLTTYRGTQVVADAVVERTGTISGTVRDGNGGYASGCVLAYTPDGELASAAEAWGDSYTLGGLDSGTYYVQFFDCHVGGWVNEWYGDSPTMAGATPVVVEYGYDTPNIDAVLTPTGTVSGRLTGPDGEPVQTCVSAVYPDGFPYVGGASDESGNYTLPRVQPETQLVFGGDCFEHVAEWWNDAPTRAEADIAHIPPATHVTGIDAVIDLSTVPGPCADHEHDIDDDRLNDCEEFVVYGTNAFDADSDDDLFGDGFEVKGGSCGPYSFDGGSDPNDSASTPLGELPAGSPPHNLPYETFLVVCR